MHLGRGRCSSLDGNCKGVTHCLGEEKRQITSCLSELGLLQQNTTLNGLNSDIYVPPFWRLESEIRVSPGWVLVRALFLAYGWLSSHCVLVWQRERERERALVSLPPLIRALIPS